MTTIYHCFTIFFYQIISHIAAKTYITARIMMENDFYYPGRNVSDSGLFDTDSSDTDPFTNKVFETLKNIFKTVKCMRLLSSSFEQSITIATIWKVSNIAEIRKGLKSRKQWMSEQIKFVANYTTKLIGTKKWMKWTKLIETSQCFLCLYQ